MSHCNLEKPKGACARQLVGMSAVADVTEQGRRTESADAGGR